MIPLMFLWHSSSGTVLQTVQVGGTEIWGDTLNSGQEPELAQGGGPTGPKSGDRKAGPLTKHSPGQADYSSRAGGKQEWAVELVVPDSYTQMPCSQPHRLSLGQPGTL